MRRSILQSDMPMAAQNCTADGFAAGESVDRPYFFDQGLHFTCQRCGRCCTGGSGVVQLTPGEIERLGLFLTMPKGTFVARYCRLVDGRLALKEKENGDCILHDGGCTVYPVRPAQCRTFPFWLKNLRSEAAWQDAARDCPGIGTGDLHEREQILRQVAESPI